MIAYAYVCIMCVSACVCWADALMSCEGAGERVREYVDCVWKEWMYDIIHGLSQNEYWCAYSQ